MSPSIYRWCLIAMKIKFKFAHLYFQYLNLTTRVILFTMLEKIKGKGKRAHMMYISSRAGLRELEALGEALGEVNLVAPNEIEK